MAEKSKLEQIKAIYVELNDLERINFHKFLEAQDKKRNDELKKMRQELASQFEKTGVLAKDYIKKLFQI